jgi:hypothetical protein
LSAKAGAPVPSIHWEKKAVSSRRLWASATFCTSSLRMPLSVNCESMPRRNFWKVSSPISQRSMWKTMAPFSRVMDWNCGEKGSMRPRVVSGSVS